MKESSQICFQPSDTTKIDSILWSYQKWLQVNYQVPFSEDYDKLHAWSIKHPELFWKTLIEFFKLDVEGSITPSFSELSFFNHPWFPNLNINYAKHLLRFALNKPNAIALHFLHESDAEEKITYQQLCNQTYQVQQYLKPILKHGDVVAAYMPNSPEVVVSMLATTALGHVFTSTSCDPEVAHQFKS